MSTCDRLRFRMSEKGLSNRRLCKLAGISRGTLGKLLREDMSGTLFTWAVISRVLDVPLDWFVSDWSDGAEG